MPHSPNNISRKYWRAKIEMFENPFQIADSILTEYYKSEQDPYEFSACVCDDARQTIEKITGKEPLATFLLITAALKVVIYRYSSQNQIGVETPLLKDLNSQEPGTENNILLLSKLNKNQTFRDFIDELKQTLESAYQYHEFPIGELALENQVYPDSDIYIWSNMLHTSPTFEGRHALCVEIDLKDSLRLTLSSPNHKITSWLLEDIYTCLVNVALQLKDPNQEISRVSRNSTPNLAERINAFNRTDKIFYESQSILDIFNELAQRIPNQVAVVHNNTQITYSELEKKASQLANYLIENYDIQKGDVVASSIPSSEWLIVSILGIMKAGGCYLPINTQFPASRVDYLLSQSNAQALVFHSSEAEQAMEFADLPLVAIDLQIDENSTELGEDISVSGEDKAYCIFTSGTTGDPKGVSISYSGLRNVALDHIHKFQMNPSDKYLQFMSNSFDGSLLDIFTTLLSGATLVMVDDGLKKKPDKLAEYIKSNEITVTTITPSYLQILDLKDMESLRIVVSAGEAIIHNLAMKYARVLDFYNGYGPTEAAINSTLYKVDPNIDYIRIPIGKPSANKKIYIVDSETRLQPVGVIGEICISGEGLASGYTNEQQLSKEKFVDNDFDSFPILYKTGDLGCWTPEGNILFLGRNDHQIKINGYRVDPYEISNVLNKHPDVRHSHIETHSTPTDSKALVAYYQKKPEKMELVPSLGEYGIYDVFLYDSMANDPMRVKGYQKAIEKAVFGKVVLDPGTGSEIILARRCVEAGAKKVYAIEIDENAYRKAKENIVKLGLVEKIELIKGDITQVKIPQNIDLVVSALAGNIASADGCIGVVRNLKTNMESKPAFLPNLYTTRIAGFYLEEAKTHMGFSPISSHYIAELFKKYGRNFDPRLCIQNIQHDCILTNAGVCETINYEQELTDEITEELFLTVEKEGLFSGFALWMNAYYGEDLIIDSLEKTHHLPVYFPIDSSDEIHVIPGDRIYVEFIRKSTPNCINPGYLIKGIVTRKGEKIGSFKYDSSYLKEGFRNHSLYQLMFEEDGTPNSNGGVGTKTSIESYLKSRLPSYMVPNQCIEVAEWPLTIHGKIETKKLPLPQLSQESNKNNYLAPRTVFEESLCEIWQDILQCKPIGIEDDFFGLGGDSIKIIQCVQQMQNQGYGIEASDIMDYPTVKSLSEFYQANERKRTGLSDNQTRSKALQITPPEKAIFEKENIEDVYPATSMQELMIGKYNEDSHLNGIYHCCTIWNFDDPELSTDKLLKSIQKLVDDNPSLRKYFALTDSGRLLQVTMKSRQVHIPIADLTDTDIQSEEKYFRKIFNQDIKNRFNVFAQDEPLIRFHLYIRSTQTFSLFISFHHAILDGWSGIELKNQLLENYSTRDTLRHKLKIDSNKEYATLEANTTNAIEARNFWSRYEIVEHNFLGNQQSHSDGGSYIFKWYELGKDAAKIVTEKSAQNGASIKAVLLEHCAMSMMDVLSETKITIGVVSNGRTDKLTEPFKTTGLFWNILPLTLIHNQDRTGLKAQVELTKVEKYGLYPYGEIEKRQQKSGLNIPCFNFVRFHNDTHEKKPIFTEGPINDRFHFPITFLVIARQDEEGMELSVRVDFNSRLISEKTIDEILTKWNLHINGIPDSSNKSRLLDEVFLK
ncbi:MAG: amino acid adenylation domain-containing protein [Symploca sp. SIO1C2]|nr:amino acid adenylation domain-containing protein [Symploca sp. SIO1C2]